MDFSKNGLLYFFLFFWKSIPLCYNPPFSLLNYYHESIHTYCFFLSSVHFFTTLAHCIFHFLFYHTDFLFPTHSNHIIILFTFSLFWSYMQGYIFGLWSPPFIIDDFPSYLTSIICLPFSPTHDIFFIMASSLSIKIRAHDPTRHTYHIVFLFLFIFLSQ